MGKSFQKTIKSNFKIRDGQSVWTNFVKKISSQIATLPVGNKIEARVYPYAKEVAGIDLMHDLDADPLHTSLASGTYYGVAYTHSDNCLCAKYPDIASSLRPTVEYYVKQQYAVIDQVAVTLIIDAIGALMVCGFEIYGTALCEARAVSGYMTKDEDDFAIGAFLLDGAIGHAVGEDFGDIHGHSSTDTNVVLIDVPFPAALQTAQTTAIRANHSETQSLFDSRINYALTYCFMTPAIKSLCELLFGMVIKFRYADSDTNRYLVCYPDNYIGNNPIASMANATNFIENLVVNHVQVILNRYSFMADMMRALGFARLSGARPSDGQPATNRLTINTSNNNINVVYDKNDAIKNVLDHNGITYDEINQAIDGTATAHDTYKRFMFTEADSYLNNELEYNDSLLMDDGVLTVLLHDGIRLYSANFIDYYKGAGNNTATVTWSVGAPKPILFNMGATFGSGLYADIAALNELINNTSLIDPSWVPVYDESAGTVIMEREHINSGINTYCAPTEDIDLIESYSIVLIALDSKTILDNNSKLGNNPDINTNAK